MSEYGWTKRDVWTAFGLGLCVGIIISLVALLLAMGVM